jgi:hypothetical protein
MAIDGERRLCLIDAQSPSATNRPRVITLQIDAIHHGTTKYISPARNPRTGIRGHESNVGQQTFRELHFQKLRHHIRGRTHRNVGLLFRECQMDFRGSRRHGGARDAGTRMEDCAAPMTVLSKR